LTELLATGFDAEGGRGWAEPHATDDAIFDDAEVVIGKLDDFSAVHADEMGVVGVVVEVGVVVFEIAAKVDFAKQSGVDEQADGSVDGGSRGGGVDGFRFGEQVLRGEVIVGGERGFEDDFALVGLAQIFALQKGIEAFFDFWVHESARETG